MRKNMTLGERIREERRKRGLTQEELAEILNVSRQAIAKWESGRGIPDMANLITISDEFGISLDEMIKGYGSVGKKIMADSNAKKWHGIVILYLLAIIVYIAYFAFSHGIFMTGFLIATLFMLVLEIAIIVRGKVHGESFKKTSNETDGIS